MATKTPKKNDFNRVHNPGDEHYDEEMRRHYEESGDPSQDIINKPTSRKDDPGEDALKEYQDQEDNPEDTSSRDEEDVGTQESRGDDVNFKNNVQAEPKKEKPSRFQALKKKRNIFLVSIALLAGVSGLFAFIGAPALLLVNFKEVMLNKFDDRMQSLETHRNYRVFLKNIGGTQTACCVI